MTTPARPVVLVTGLSGAGRSSILHHLEDLGFETVDNPPLDLLEELVGDGAVPLAAGIDARSRGFDPAQVLLTLARLRLRPDIAVTLVFATAETAVLQRRYSETRRRHPLAPGGPLGNRVTDGIAREQALLAPLQEAADMVVDTSDLPLPDLRQLIERLFRREETPGLRSMSGPSASRAACRATPSWSSTCASCATRTTTRRCGRSPAGTRRSPPMSRPTRTSPVSGSGSPDSSIRSCRATWRRARSTSPSPWAAPGAATARSLWRNVWPTI